MVQDHPGPGRDHLFHDHPQVGTAVENCTFTDPPETGVRKKNTVPCKTIEPGVLFYATIKNGPKHKGGLLAFTFLSFCRTAANRRKKWQITEKEET
jgi:hypothetical protein